MRGALFAFLLTVWLATPATRADAAGSGQFVVRCEYSHTLADDPIVFPGQPGASHLHDFFGNTSANASSTVESMLASDTKCRAASDTAGYWAPTAFLNGQQITPTVMRIYYLGNQGQQTETIPAGLKIIGGNRYAGSPAENPHVRWYCGEIREVKTPRSDTPYDCSSLSSLYAFVDGVVAIIDLPNCWDGVGLEPQDVTYPDGGRCPTSYPRVLPRLSERIHYGIMNPIGLDGSVGLTLSSGAYWSMHADFWNTWQQDRLDDLVASCLSGGHCGSIEASASIDWTRQFGTRRYDLAFAAAAGTEGPYVAGFTNYELPGQTYRRRSDVFLRAYDVAGNTRWTRQLGSSGDDQALAVSSFRHRLVIAGFTDGRLPAQTARGGADALVASFSDSGELHWLVQFGSKADEYATAIASGGTSGLYVAGWTDGTLSEGHRKGARDAWIAKLSWQGEMLWMRQFGTDEMDEVRALAVQGNRVLAAGWTDGSLPSQSSGGGSDAFVRAYGADGTVVWTRQFGTSGADTATALAGHGSEVFVAGTTDATFLDQQPTGGLDVFIRGMDENGASTWTDQFGTPADDDAAALVARQSGVYLAGSTLGSLTDAGQLGGSDVFARRYMRNGIEMWTMQLGTADYDRGYGASIDADSLYLTGTTHGTFEGETNTGDRDVFLLRVRFT